ncbi:MAG TPA: hypothetical protein VKU39_16685 [Streptosporangiaceae bacterium]|nr:hypothetical protein [Streptosporangiaceae bacterium]
MAGSRSRARLAGFSALAATLAATVVAGSPAAQAGVPAGPALDRRVVVFWGADNPALMTEAGLTGVAQVSAGGLHSLALRRDGTVWAWGNNFAGQLGDGTTTSRNTPVMVNGLTGVVQVSAGGLHSLALRSDGTVWEWGDVGAGLDPFTPILVSGLSAVTSISAGDLFSLARRSDGTVWAWGDNRFGQLGDGTTAGSRLPVQVAGLSHVTSISAGFDAALAVRTGRLAAIASVWAWGSNSHGQLGDGTLASHITPEQVTGIRTPFVAGISAGHQFAVVLGTDGTVWGWGANESGELDKTPSTAPVSRPTELTVTGSGITQLSAGFSHVLALRSNGTVLAWGDNSAGELGTGRNAGYAGPVQVPVLGQVRQVSAGGLFSLAIYPQPMIITPVAVTI